MTCESRLGALLLTVLVLLGAAPTAWANPEQADEKIVGMYVHQHWPYNSPYAARTWTLEEWEGYIEGLRLLGYNTVKIWPVLETMPEPLTESDAANLEKIRRVIDILHEKGMKAVITLAPNVVANSAVARLEDFEDRTFFYCDLRVDPGDPAAVERMIRWREELMRPLAQADMVTFIDSDPGGYPGSDNAEFINLFIEHRKMLDRLRPGIELVYWMHAGWPAYSRFYETGEFAFGPKPEFLEAIEMIKEANPEPWGLAGKIRYAELTGCADRALDYRYGAIEGEPMFPLTNYGDTRAYDAASGEAVRGVMGNAQTHCLQLPNTFAFARGARGESLEPADYVEFANDLIPEHGELIVEGWQSLWSGEAKRKLEVAKALETLSKKTLKTGRLEGLLFGDPERFLMDIALQLRLHAACDTFCDASENGEPIAVPFAEFTSQFASWQARHGYEGRIKWRWDRLDAALDRLNDPKIDGARRIEPFVTGNPLAEIKENYSWAETATSRLTRAMTELAVSMSTATTKENE